MITLSAKSSVSEFRQVAKNLGITLTGDARKKGVKAGWLKQIDAATKAEVTHFDVLAGVTAYRYTAKPFVSEGNSTSITLEEFLLDRLGCSKSSLAVAMSDCIHKLHYLDFDKDRKLELTTHGTYMLRKTLQENQLYLHIVDGAIIDILTHTQFYTGTMNTSTKHKRYSVYVSIHLRRGVNIVSSVSSSPLIYDEIQNAVNDSDDERIKDSLEFWGKYNNHFKNDLLFY